MRRTVGGTTALLWLAGSLLLGGCDRRQPTATGPLAASGTIEAEQLYVAPEVGGRIVVLSADKGDLVEAGLVLARLDATLLEAQQTQAESAVMQAHGALEAAQAQLDKARAGARPEEIAGAQSALAATKAGLDSVEAQRDAARAGQRSAQANLAGAQGQLRAAQAGSVAAQAAVDAAQAGLTRALSGATVQELDRAERAVEAAKNALWGTQAQRDGICGHVDQGVKQSDCDQAQAAVQSAEEQVRIAESQLEELRAGARTEEIAALRAEVDGAKARWEAAQAEIDVAQAGVAAAEGASDLAKAQVSETDAGMASAEAQRDQAQTALDLLLAGTRSEDLALLEAQVKQADAALVGSEAALRGVEAQIERLTLSAPIRSVVLERTGHVGELAVAGAPLFALADLTLLTLTVYIPEPDLGGVALQQEVEVTVDAYGRAFSGRVKHIASRAEFTPKNVEMREERVNMVFAVEVALDNAEGLLLPGMPADAVFAPRP